MSVANRRYKSITAAYWFMLLYVIAALIWWFISLEQQNHAMYDMRTTGLDAAKPSDAAIITQANDFLKRKHAQYIGEGVIFLALILAGAVLVFRAIRKELMLSRQQQNFMMAITHELKTPIAAAKLNIETLTRHKLDEEKTSRLLSNTLAETERLNELADNILVATRLDSLHYSLQPEPTAMATIVAGLIELMRQRYPQINWHWQNDGSDQFQVDGEPLLLKLMVANLLENAAKYAAKGKEVTLTLGRQEGKLTLIVADKGAGIPEEEKRRVFQKFYRMGSEITRGAKGTGLGLFLVDRIVRDHGGTIHIEDNTPSGCRFVVRLPLTA